MKYRYKFLILTIFLFNSLFSFSQERKNIALEDIWAKGTFRFEQLDGFKWMNGDESYSAMSENLILRINILRGEISDTLFKNTSGTEIDEYEFNEQEDKILIASESEQLYRHSFIAKYYVFDLKTKKLHALFPEKISYATFSPDGEKVAFVTHNNLYYVDLKTLESFSITKDGEINSIINGSTDWVYEEEFSFTRAFFWSSDSRKIAYYKFDESQVKEYSLQLWNDLYPTVYKYKYPKAGEKNSDVSIHCYFLDSKKTININTGEEKDNYIPRVKWTNDPNILSIQRLNRLQNNFELLHADVLSNQIKVAYTEFNDTYVEINDDLTYLKDGKHFLLTSEKNGFNHIYKFDFTGQPIEQVTKGNWEVDKFLGIDETMGNIYFTSTEVSPLERHLYSIHLNGKNKHRLTEKKGWHNIELSRGYKYFLDNFSTINTPPQGGIHLASNGKLQKIFVTNKELINKMELFKISPVEFFEFKTPDNTSINGYMIKPLNFDPQKKYPVFMNVYGGPGHQSVTDEWKGANFFWFQMLAQQGYIVVSVDNRGTGGRGADFKKITQSQLGKYETIDVINTAKYLGGLSYIDGNRIGIFGWSFGGYLSSLAMTVGADYFKTGIAVAPVISWRFYDTIYTERYLGLPQDNPSGYDNNSPLSHAEKLKGNYLLIHGTADDNVHLQNSYAMQDALIKANKQFQVFYYPDRNHSIYGGITRYHLYKMMTDFLFKNL